MGARGRVFQIHWEGHLPLDNRSWATYAFCVHKSGFKRTMKIDPVDRKGWELLPLENVDLLFRYIYVMNAISYILWRSTFGSTNVIRFWRRFNEKYSKCCAIPVVCGVAMGQWSKILSLNQRCRHFRLYSLCVELFMLLIRLLWRAHECISVTWVPMGTKNILSMKGPTHFLVLVLCNWIKGNVSFEILFTLLDLGLH